MSGLPADKLKALASDRVELVKMLNQLNLSEIKKVARYMGLYQTYYDGNGKKRCYPKRVLIEKILFLAPLINYESGRTSEVLNFLSTPYSQKNVKYTPPAQFGNNYLDITIENATD